MRKIAFSLALILVSLFGKSQKIESIYFNLYTDSLKKGFYNYINVDGHSTDDRWFPLDSTTIRLTTNGGTFKGNSLFIDSSYTGETVTVKAVLRSNPAVWKETVIYIRRRGFDEPLKTAEEILDEMRRSGGKTKVKTKKS
ncbi:MAG: hypothetical protein JWP27_983 [Flaviaesturariibacter sp.]|nr:hypothetical protein [Flaviaesturariibacter sp.]